MYIKLTSPDKWCRMISSIMTLRLAGIRAISSASVLSGIAVVEIW